MKKFELKLGHRCVPKNRHIYSVCISIIASKIYTYNQLINHFMQMQCTELAHLNQTLYWLYFEDCNTSGHTIIYNQPVELEI